MPKGSSCKAKGCTSNKTDNPELSFHSFPKSKERFKIWCDLIKRPDLNHSKAITNRMSMRVCSLHFEDRMYMSPNNKSRLIWCAVPKPVTDSESSESQSSSSSNLSENLDNKAAVAKNIEAQEKQMGITAIQPTESTVLAQPLPLAKGSKKFDWSLSLDEDVIIKEESMMDQDNHLDLSNPPSPATESPISFRSDTKEGILKHDQSETTDDCTEYSLFLSPSGNDSSPESPCEEETNLSHRDNKYSEEMNTSASTSHQQEVNATKPSLASIKSSDPKKDISSCITATSTADVWSPIGSSSFNASQVSNTPNVPSRLTVERLSVRKLSSNGDEDTPTSTLLHVKDEPIRPSETSLDSWPQLENTDRPIQLSEHTAQKPEKTLHVSTSIPHQPSSFPPIPCTTQLSQSHAVSPVSTTVTSQSDTSLFSNTVPLQLKTEKTSLLSSSIGPPQQNSMETSESAHSVQPFQLKASFSSVNATQSIQIDTSSPSLSLSQSSPPLSSPLSQSSTTVNSMLLVKEPKVIQSKSSTSDTVKNQADRDNPTEKVSSGASVDEEPIVVDEDDVTIVDEREDAECEKECQCTKCQEKKKLPPETNKPVYHVHRTYSGPVKRQIVKTKGGGKRTFMILNKASLKVLQAKGLIQPLKKYADSQLPTSETLLPSAHPVQNKEKIQYHSVVSTPDSLHESSPPSFENASVLPKHLALSNKAPCSFPQTSSQTPVVVTWSATTGTDTPSFTFTIQLPPGQNQPPGTPQVPIQIVTPPVSVGGSAHTSIPTQLNSFSTNSNKVSPAAKKSYGLDSQSPLCSDSSIVSSQFSRTGTETHKSLAPLMMTHSIITSVSQSKNFTHTNTFTTESSKHTTKSPITSIQHPLVSHESPGDQDHTFPSGMESSLNDLEISNNFSSSGPSSPVDESPTNKSEVKPTAVGFASGPCKVRKGGVKMYRYVNMPDDSTGIGQANKPGPKSNQNVRWVALPTVPISSNRPLTSDTLKQVISALQQNTQQANMGTGKIPSSTSISSDCFPITPIEQKAGRPSVHTSPYKSANKELKKKYARLLNKHRQRYHLLLKKYKTLESKFAVVEDAGTPEQVIRDAKNFLSDEHVLFLESQMFLRNRPGTGNRFSKKFMKLMIEYYKRSAAGYRFLRTIFTIPSVKTVQKWLNKPLNIREEVERDPLAIPMQRSEIETANNREDSVRASGSGLRKLQNTANSEHGSEETECYSSSKYPQGRSTPEESDMEEGSSEEYESEESGLEEMEDDDIQQSENSGKKNPRQSNHGSDEQEITIEWEEEPWPTVVME